MVWAEFRGKKVREEINWLLSQRKSNSSRISQSIVNCCRGGQDPTLCDLLLPTLERAPLQNSGLPEQKPFFTVCT